MRLRHTFFIPTLLAILCLCELPGLAWANGRPPNTTFLRINPYNSQQWLLGVTFGLVLSNDGGVTFQWICEQAANGDQGFQGADPVTLWVNHNSLVLATFDSLVSTSDGGCTWTTHALFSNLFVTDLAGQPANPNMWYVAAVDPNTNQGSVYATTDRGQHYNALSLAVANVGWQSVRVAPSLPSRLYATGWNINNYNGPYLATSVDGGATWINQLISNGPGGISDPQVRVSPADPNVLLVAVTNLVNGGGSTVVLRVDAPTATGTPVGTYGDGFRDAVFSADGQTVWLATLSHVYRSTDSGRTFAPLGAPTSNACVALEGNTLYACGNDLTDHFALARSGDGGHNWTSTYALSATQGPLTCPAGTVEQAVCPSLWPAIAGIIRAGQGVTSVGGTSTATTGTASTPASTKRGCHCQGGDTNHALWLAGLVGMVRRRWRRQQTVACQRGDRAYLQ